jgi:hypothetical protein
MKVDVAPCSRSDKPALGWLLIIDCRSSGVVYDTEEEANFAAQDLLALDEP